VTPAPRCFRKLAISPVGGIVRLDVRKGTQHKEQLT
jgi:hypothetical protein